MVNPDSIHPQVFRLGKAELKASESARFPLGLGEKGVHEVCEDSFGDIGALTGFVLAASLVRPGVIVWVSQYDLAREHGEILGQGQAFLRRDLRPVLKVAARRRDDVLWGVEEAITSRAVSLVVAELSGVDFTASRRLQLASERTGTPVILMLPYTTEGATAATARWRIRPEISAPNRYDSRAPGAARWHVRIERSRLAPELAGREFKLELDDETLSLRVASGLAAHTAAPHKARTNEGNRAGFRDTG